MSRASVIATLRLYLDPADIGSDGYPHQWHGVKAEPPTDLVVPAIKDTVRAEAGHRCERCGHPYPPGIAKRYPRGEWTPCDEQCRHGGPVRWQQASTLGEWTYYDGIDETIALYVEARWRILTVHHLNGVKYDCRWWNLAALCQRCHLAVQGHVLMERVYQFEHTDWFKPHAAGWYAWSYLGEELSRDETIARLDELLALEAA